MLELIHKVLFAFVSGFSELIFVSASAHQRLYRIMTGHELADTLLPLAIHAGCLTALLFHCGKRIKHLRYEKRLQLSTRRRRGRQPDIASLMDVRILNTAVVPLLLGFLFFRKAETWVSNPVWLALILLINGAVLFLPRLLRTGNKDGRTFTQLDGLMMGVSGALGGIPGFSRLGCMYSVGVACGAEKSYALEMSLLLTVPAVSAMLCFDLYGCAVAAGGVSGLQILGAIMAAMASFGGAHVGISFTRLISSRSTTVGFAYYSCGLAMFLLLIYLFIP